MQNRGILLPVTTTIVRTQFVKTLQMDYEKEKRVAIEAVTQAAQICLKVQADQDPVEYIEKEDGSPVTVADLACQIIITHRLSEVFPQDLIIAEENSVELTKTGNIETLNGVVRYVRQFLPEINDDTACQLLDTACHTVSRRFWALDPIDGTKGFLRRQQYAIALALIDNDQVQFSILGCPALPATQSSGEDTGIIVFAVRGQGAFESALGSSNCHPIRVSRNPDPSTWRFVENVEAGHGNPELQGIVAQKAGILQPPIRIDGQGKYVLVARGDAVLYVRFPGSNIPGHKEKIWDHAAGALIVEEAGGFTSDMDGCPLEFSSSWIMQKNRGIIASNGILQETALNVLKGKEFDS